MIIFYIYCLFFIQVVSLKEREIFRISDRKWGWRLFQVLPVMDTIFSNMPLTSALSSS
jgi:hypothetical protein